MATYGDKYLFTFEVRASTASLNRLTTLKTSATQAATAFNALADAVIRLNAALGASSPINIQNSVIGNTVTGNLNSQNALAQSGSRATNSTRTTTGGGGVLGGNRTTMLSHIGRHAVFAAEAMAIYGAYQLVTNAASEWVDIQRTLDRQIVEFGYSVSRSRSDIENYIEEVLKISSVTGVPLSEVGRSLIMQTRVGNQPGDLALRSAQVQQLTGADNMQVTRDLLALSKQFPDMTTVEILDAFVGALSTSTLEAEEFFAMLESTGPLTRQFNTNIETILGMFAGLSTAAGESGSSIELFMRQMERVYTEDSTRSMIEQLTRKQTITIDAQTGEEVRRPIQEIMADISKLSQAEISKIAETIPNMLGQQTRQLFLSMIQNWETVLHSVGNSENANAAFEGAFADWEGTWDAKLARLKTAWQEWLFSLTDSNAAKGVIEYVTKLFDMSANDRQLKQQVQEYFDYIGASGIAPEKAFMRMDALQEASRRYEAETGEKKQLSVSPIGQFDTYHPVLSMTQQAAFAKIFEQMMQEAIQKSRDQAVIGLAAQGPWGAPMSLARDYSAFRGAWTQPQFQSVQSLQSTAPKYGTTFQIDEGVQMDRLLEIYNELVTRRRDQLRGVYQMQGYTVDDEALDKQLGLDTKSTTLILDDVGAAIDVFTGNLDVLEVAATMASDEVEALAGKVSKTFSFDASISEIAKGDTLTRVGQEYERRISEIMRSAIEVNPELASKSQSEILAFAGVTEEYVTLVDDQGRVLREVAVDLGVFSDAVEDVAVAARQMEYADLPQGWSSARYLSELQSQADQNIAVRREWGAEVGPISQHLINTGAGIGYVTGDEESLRQAEFELGRIADIEGDAADAARKSSEQHAALLKRIADGVESFAAELLQPTEVTQGDLSKAKLGTYEDKWDEPVRKVQDVMDRAAGDNPDRGPWQDFARSVGIDTTSKDTILATGEDFKNKFYNGMLAPEFYDQYSKEPFINAARQKMAEKEGRSALQQQAVGWLNESGIGGELAEMLSREYSGDMSPIESYWRGGKTDTELAEDFKPLAVTTTGAIDEGVKQGLEKAKMVDVFVGAWDVNDKANHDSLYGLGKTIGGVMVEGVGDVIAERIQGTVEAKVIDKILARMGMS